MTGSNPNKSGWSDEDVERLLQCFYREEMPASLRKPKTVAGQTRAEASPRSAVLVLGLLVSAACLFLAVFVLMPDEGEPRLTEGDEARQVTPVADSADSDPEASSVAEADAVRERVRYDTESGPVEQRTNVRWKNVSLGDESGEGVEVMIPELQIDVFPIDEEPESPERDASDAEFP